MNIIYLLIKRKNVINYINSHIIDLDDKINDRSGMFLATIATRFMFGKEDVVIDCNNECQAKTLFMQIQNLLRNSNVEDKNEDLQFYHDMEFVHSNITAIIPRFAEYADVIVKLPEDIREDFKLETLYTHIGNLEPIYNEKRMHEMLSLITEYNNYIELLDVYNREEQTLSKFEGLSDLKGIKSIIEKIENSIEETNDKINKYKQRNSELMEERYENERTLEVYTEIKETIENVFQ